MSGLPIKPRQTAIGPRLHIFCPPRAGRGARSSRCGVPGRQSRSGGRPGTRQRRDGGGGWGRIVFSSRVIDSLLAFYFLSCRSWIWFAVGFSPFTSILSFRLRYYCTAIFQHTNPAVTMTNISTIITICSLPAFVLFFNSALFFAFGFSLVWLRFVFEIIVSLLYL